MLQMGGSTWLLQCWRCAAPFRVGRRGEVRMLSCRAVAATHAVEAAEAVERQQPRGRASAESVRGEWCERVGRKRERVSASGVV